MGMLSDLIPRDRDMFWPSTVLSRDGKVRSRPAFGSISAEIAAGPGMRRRYHALSLSLPARILSESN